MFRPILIYRTIEGCSINDLSTFGLQLSNDAGLVPFWCVVPSYHKFPTTRVFHFEQQLR